MRHLVFSSLVLWFVASVSADVVVLQSGERIEGRIIAESKARIVISQSGTMRSIERAVVKQIEKSPVAAAPVQEAPVETAIATAAATEPKFEFWPPKHGERFPDLNLFDRNGRIVRLSSFKGKIIILEPVGMTCSACQAFSGGNRVGGLEGVQPQADCPALGKYFTSASTGATLDDPRIVWVQLILYNMQMQAPTVDDLKRWCEHFPDVRRPNCQVLAATPEMLGNASYAMIPGIQLIDRNFVLRSDFRGHGGGDDLGQHLLPLVRQLALGPGK